MCFFLPCDWQRVCFVSSAFCLGSRNYWFCLIILLGLMSGVVRVVDKKPWVWIIVLWCRAGWFCGLLSRPGDDDGSAEQQPQCCGPLSHPVVSMACVCHTSWARCEFSLWKWNDWGVWGWAVSLVFQIPKHLWWTEGWNAWAHGL